MKLLVPFLFVTMPGLLMIGGAAEIALSLILALAGVVGITIAFAGWLARPLAAVERGLMVLAALLVLWPAAVTATDPLTLAARLAGVVGLAALFYHATARGPAPSMRGGRAGVPRQAKAVDNR